MMILRFMVSSPLWFSARSRLVINLAILAEVSITFARIEDARAALAPASRYRTYFPSLELVAPGRAA